MSVGDRLQNPISPTTGSAYAIYEVLSETGDSSGFKQAAMLTKQAVSSNQASTATLSNVSASATSGTLLAANTSRRGAIIFNDADKALSVKYGATASASSFTVQIAAGGYWEMPLPIYTGVLDGIWASGPTGAARVTELT